MDLEVIAEREE